MLKNRLTLIQKKERWGLTTFGWIIVLFTLIAGVAFGVRAIHPFLAISRPVTGDILVVEGWLPDYALQMAMAEFKTHDYSLLVTTGIPLNRGYHLSRYKTWPVMAEATLKELGFDEIVLKSVPAPRVGKDGTYASALALKKWLKTLKLPVKSLNICSLGPHARRTRLLFQKALGNEIDVGVIAFQSQDYDPQAWWKSSKGVRSVIDETIAYLYARLFVSIQVSH